MFDGTPFTNVTSGSSGTINDSVPAGSYNFTIGTVADYIASPSNGTVVVTGANVTMTITFSHVPVPDLITFTEAGLPAGTNWSVTLGAGSNSSTSSNVAFFELNGTFSYTVGAVAGYLPSPALGTLTVSGGPMNVAIDWSVMPPTTYTVTFSETGLPTGTTWSVRLGTDTQYSSTAAIVFHAPNGTLPYAIPAVAGYSGGTATGNVTIAGTSSTVDVTFAAVPPAKYTVTFTESGLPSGTHWSVKLDGKITSSSGSTIRFSVPNGTHSYAVPNVANYSRNGGGVVSVTGAPVALTVSFALVKYGITFTESGLPRGTHWSVTIGTTTVTSGTDTVLFHHSNGTYSYRVGQVPHYSRTGSGSFTVRGGTVSVSVKFRHGLQPSVVFVRSVTGGGSHRPTVVGSELLVALGRSVPGSPLQSQFTAAIASPGRVLF
jgi:hypothetical protein